MKVKIAEDEHKKLMKLYDTAQTTPVIAMTVEDGLAGRDWASQAWDEVREYLNELGKKYGYNPQTAQISKVSLEFEAESA